MEYDSAFCHNNDYLGSGQSTKTNIAKQRTFVSVQKTQGVALVAVHRGVLGSLVISALTIFSYEQRLMAWSRIRESDPPNLLGEQRFYR